MGGACVTLNPKPWVQSSGPFLDFRSQGFPGFGGSEHSEAKVAELSLQNYSHPEGLGLLECSGDEGRRV